MIPTPFCHANYIGNIISPKGILKQGVHNLIFGITTRFNAKVTFAFYTNHLPFRHFADEGPGRTTGGLTGGVIGGATGRFNALVDGKGFVFAVLRPQTGWRLVGAYPQWTEGARSPGLPSTKQGQGFSFESRGGRAAPSFSAFRPPSESLRDYLFVAVDGSTCYSMSAVHHPSVFSAQSTFRWTVMHFFVLVPSTTHARRKAGMKICGRMKPLLLYHRPP